LVVSGRASFELVQKSIVAGISMMVAIGAPSSLAIQTAERFGMALAGFASQSRFNLYTDPQQIIQ
jgi:FdhD protein